MKQQKEPPMTITSGYPEKKFHLIGWEPVQIGGRRAAKRNRVTVLMPIYQAADGETILVPLFSKKS
jgi:hypothetical protein